MKKIYTILTLSTCIIILQSGVKNVNYSSVPPQGYTGATGSYCTDCHSSFALNSGGGSVTPIGLPSGGYTLAGYYKFSLKITHGTANRKRWGFSIKAVDGSGNPAGTLNGQTAFKSKPNGSELSHFNAATTSFASTYTYDSLTWVAPGTNVGPVTFYYVGNAASGTNPSDGNANDYIYSGSTVISLPIDLKDFTAVADNGIVILKWQTATEINSNYFDVERSDDGQFFFSIGKVNASGNTSQGANYSFTDKKLTNNNGGQIFYRLKLVDKDGTIKYSKQLSVKPVISGVTIKNIYPTIIRKGERAKVEVVSDKARTLEFVVLSESGQILQSFSTNLTAGFNQFSFLPIANNMKGMLFVRFTSTNFQQTKSLVLQ